MLRDVSRPLPLAGLLLAGLPYCASLASGCGAASSQDPSGTRDDAQDVDRWPGLRTGEPATVLEVLGQPHAQNRAFLGAHRIETTSDLRLTPATPGPANPPLDAAVVADQAVRETAVLRWAPPDARGPRLSLDQRTATGSKRGVLAVDGDLYTQIDARPWTRFAVETDVHELWLDDVQRIAGDTVEFLLRGGTITTEQAPGEGWNGGAGLRVRLQKSSGSAHDGVTQAGIDRDGMLGMPGWRDQIAFDALDATLTLDVGTGAWLTLDATATYTVSGGAGGPLNGSLKVSGRVVPLPENEAIFSPPAEAVALPQRHRYEGERKRLLDGLAAP